jgi:hypothetical protein
VDDVVVLNEPQSLAAGVQGVRLAERDHLVRVRRHQAGLGLGGPDTVVDDQRSDHSADQVLLVARPGGETGSFSGLRHD